MDLNQDWWYTVFGICFVYSSYPIKHSLQRAPLSVSQRVAPSVSRGVRIGGGGLLPPTFDENSPKLLQNKGFPLKFGSFHFFGTFDAQTGV